MVLITLLIYLTQNLEIFTRRLFETDCFTMLCIEFYIHTLIINLFSIRILVV